MDNNALVEIIRSTTYSLARIEMELRLQHTCRWKTEMQCPFEIKKKVQFPGSVLALDISSLDIGSVQPSFKFKVTTMYDGELFNIMTADYLSLTELQTSN